jgi:hypothetical protein
MIESPDDKFALNIRNRMTIFAAKAKAPTPPVGAFPSLRSTPGSTPINSAISLI